MRDLDGTSLILSDEDLLKMVQVFMQDYDVARRIETNTITSINRLVRYGFMTKRSDGRYTVRPLLRAKIDADELEGIKSRLVAHTKQDIELDDDENE